MRNDRVGLESLGIFCQVPVSAMACAVDATGNNFWAIYNRNPLENKLVWANYNLQFVVFPDCNPPIQCSNIIMILEICLHV